MKPIPLAPAVFGPAPSCAGLIDDYCAAVAAAKEACDRFDEIERKLIKLLEPLGASICLVHGGRAFWLDGDHVRSGDCLAVSVEPAFAVRFPTPRIPEIAKFVGPAEAVVAIDSDTA